MAVFDDFSESYDSWYETKMGAFADKVESDLILKQIKYVPGMHVLDSGCGTGNYTLKLLNKGCRVTGIDVSVGMLKIARQKILKHAGERAAEVEACVEFKVNSVYDLKYPDNYFDAVISASQFEFLDDREKALSELLRVVKPGGRVIVGTINRESAWGKLYMSEEVRNSSVFKYAALMTEEELTTLHGNKLINIEKCLFIPPDSSEENINEERERELSETEEGGFICAVWEK